MNWSLRGRLILAAILPLFLTTGCWDSSEVNDLALELAWGIDEAKDKGILISAQVIIPSQISSVQGQGGGSGGGRESPILSYPAPEEIRWMRCSKCKRSFPGWYSADTGGSS